MIEPILEKNDFFTFFLFAGGGEEEEDATPSAGAVDFPFSAKGDSGGISTIGAASCACCMLADGEVVGL